MCNWYVKHNICSTLLRCFIEFIKKGSSVFTGPFTWGVAHVLFAWAHTPYYRGKQITSFHFYILCFTRWNSDHSFHRHTQKKVRSNGQGSTYLHTLRPWLQHLAKNPVDGQISPVQSSSPLNETASVLCRCVHNIVIETQKAVCVCDEMK